MIPLAVNFEKSGWQYKQLKRNDKAAIYKRTNSNFPELVYYEAIKIIIQNEKVAKIAGNIVTFASQELYPGNEQFGMLGKCCMSLEKAERYYQEFTYGESVQRTIAFNPILSPLWIKKCKIKIPLI
jgi:hypothetical protein